MAHGFKWMALTTARWAAAWAVVGLFLGCLMMLGRVPPIAEPGAPSGFGFYAFWIPVCLGATSLFGLLMGLIYSCLMTAMDLWFPSSELKPGFVASYGQRMLCGAIAGGAIGFPLMRSAEGVYALMAGMISGLVSGYLNRPKIRVRG
jgi:hypothetical protein